MTEEADKPRASSDKTKRVPLPSIKSVGNFLVNVLALERSVAALKAHNKELDDQVLALQRQVDDQAGQLKVLVSFVQTSLRDQIEGRAERAVINVLNRLTAASDDPAKDKVDDRDR